MKKIAVIGAGASGILAALFAQRKGNTVTLFEKQNKIGRKILSTGNGRCNISNRFLDISHYHGSNVKFIMNVFSKFGLNDTIKYFESIGLPVVEENDGRLFPESGQASSVVDLLIYELKLKGVDLRLNRMVEKIKTINNKFKITTAGKEEHVFDSAILSLGSCAHPQLGASYAGYELAASLGHNILDPFPAIVPLSIPQRSIHALQGIKHNCKASVIIKGKTAIESTGELLFTNYGISGPVALNISRIVNQNIINNNPVILIDFFPDTDELTLKNKLKQLWIDGNKSLSFSLTGILKKRIPDMIFKASGIDPEKPVKVLTVNEKTKIIRTFKSFEIIPGKPRSFKEAVIASGGVLVNEINPATMESKIIKNLFITGELLDIDGDSGGYNLQFAWSTGALAGMAQ